MHDDQSFEIDEILEQAYRSEIYVVARSIAIGLALGAVAIVYGPLNGILMALAILPVMLVPASIQDRALALLRRCKTVLHSGRHAQRSTGAGFNANSPA